MAVRPSGLAASVKGAFGAAVLAWLGAVLIGAGSMALAFQAGVPEPPFDDTTVRVDVSWPHDLVMLAYDLAPVEDKPYASGSPGVWPVTCGAAGQTLYLSEASLLDRPRGDWVYYQTFGSGTYRLVVEFGGHCYDLDTPVDAVDPAFEAFPEGSAVPFTATVRYYAPEADRPYDTVTLTGAVTVEFDPNDLAGLTDVGPIELRTDVPAGFTGEGGQLPDVGTPLIPPAVAGAPPPSTDETATEADAAPALSRRDGSNRTPLLIAVVAALVLLIVALLLLNRRMERSFDVPPGGPGDFVPKIGVDDAAEIAAEFITDPASFIEVVADRAETAEKASAGPQFSSTGEPAGEVRIVPDPIPAQAVSPDGKTLDLPPGTSYPAGATVTWYGVKWTSIQVGTDWWWVRADQPGVHTTFEEALDRPPEAVHMPPYTKFRLTENMEVRTGPSATTVLQPGTYDLGHRFSKTDGDYYWVHCTTPDGKPGASVTIEVSSLPRDSGLPSRSSPA